MGVQTPSPGARRAALAFIFVVVLIDVMAFGVIIPVLPHLIEDFVGGDISVASWWVGIFAVLFAAIQFVFAPIQGALSDRYGRRPVILLSCLGLGLDFVLMALAPTLAWLLVGRIVSAITAASFSTANAYIADVTSGADRARGYGMIGAAFGVGFIAGPLIGGVLGDIDLRLPFWFAAGMALLNFLYGLFVLPESLPAERRSARIHWSHANPLGSLGLLRAQPQVMGLAVVVLISAFAHYAHPSVFVLYADYRYGWGQKEVGYVLAFVGAMAIVVNAWLVGLLVKRMGERRALILALCFGAAGFAVTGLAPVGWLFLVGIPIGALWGVAAPASQSLITRQVDPAMQGRVQGALMSLTALAGVVGPAVYAGSFGWAVSPASPIDLPGIPYLVASSMLLLAIAVAWRHARLPAAPASAGDMPAGP
ncbi:TCR/Tet family MFS transporter [Luteimonas arsenica]|uniref:TCR/Tet family MFS transporter n=1 Tax=Luteimonas arsenica TaxID=1586242 RepID=UPI001FB79B39|nr:TCR/Tet family MFS transporter [Luteimonas arsenica]